MASKDPGNLNILNWAEDDRPREKLIKKGKGALSDAELVAILLGSGTRALSAVELAKQVLKGVDNNLHTLARLSVQDLTKIKGIGQAKAISIVSALELGRRRTEAPMPQRPQVRSSMQMYRYMKPMLMDLPTEEFWVIALNTRCEVLHRERISMGGVNRMLVDHKKVVKVALDHHAAQIAVAHNHPSNNLQPSMADKSLTDDLVQICQLLDLPLLDHIIVCDHEYYSFRDDGLIG